MARLVLTIILMCISGIVFAGNDSHADQGSAYHHCMVGASVAIGRLSDAIKDRYPPTGSDCILSFNTTRGYYSCVIRVDNHWGDGIISCETSGAVDIAQHYFPIDQLCSSRADFVSTFSPPNGSVGCRGGCAVMYFDNGDGTTTSSPIGGSAPVCTDQDGPADCARMGDGWSWDPYVHVCIPSRPPDPDPDPDSGDGDGNGDGDGDGDGDGEGDDSRSFSWDGSCGAAPACSGDPILCGQVRLQWRIQCNTKRDRQITGGSCQSVPVCAGEDCDPMEYHQLLMMWRTACASELMASAIGNNNSGGDQGQPAWTRVDGMTIDPGAGSTLSDTDIIRSPRLSLDSLDRSGFGGGSCVGFGVSSGDFSSAFLRNIANPPPMWCDFISSIRAVMLLVGSIASVVIILRG